MPNHPKPIEQKRLLGNPGKHGKLPDRSTLVALPAVGTESPDSPRPLGIEGQKMWDRIWFHGRQWISTGPDLDLVLLLCEAMDERVMLRVRVFRDGEWRDRVGLRHLDMQITSLLGQLGFTPIARANMGVAEVRRATALEELVAKRAR